MIHNVMIDGIWYPKWDTFKSYNKFEASNLNILILIIHENLAFPSRNHIRKKYSMTSSNQADIFTTPFAKKDRVYTQAFSFLKFGSNHQNKIDA